MCKETSVRILITDDPSEKISKWDGMWIEDPETGIVFARHDIRNEVQRKIGVHCLTCEDKGAREGHPMVRKFPTVKVLREHFVKQHKFDFCELCID